MERRACHFLVGRHKTKIQSECADLRCTHAHLSQRTPPSRKLMNIRDITRYRNVASIAHDGLLVVRRDQPLTLHRDRIIVPRHIIEGLLTAIHIQLDHPIAYQLKKVVGRYLYALDLDKAVDTVTEVCHQCTSLKRVPKIPIPQSSSDPPDGVGISFAADIFKRNRQNIMILRECVTSCTTSCIVQSKKHEDLRDALICLCCELNPLQGPLSVVRVDPAPAFRALMDDPMLRKYRIQVEVGRTKNPNHNPVAEKAIQDLKSEIVRQIAHTDIVTPRILAVVAARLNTRIRNNGMSAREMWFQRDQYTNEHLPINDFERICEQHSQREQNHVYSKKAKCPRSTAKEHQEINIGDIVYSYVKKTLLV